MDQYRADLHIHSKYSRATSKNLTPRHLAAWAQVKGLDVVATGDFTHPQWLEELKSQLVYDHGLYRLKDATGLDAEISWHKGQPLPGDVRFLLSAEISSIYKRGGKVRKIHNLVYVPTFEAAEKLNVKLAKVGNLASDGRPILGLDSRHLLEMVLETDPKAFLVPAHIWTPWFSLFGSKSGFDSVEECFGGLSSHIFALETGLSSDPEMNWLLSSLDRFRLISNSDAHSGEKLGREANFFSGPRTFEAIYHALKGEGTGQEFLGTVEFFPEEGKYHLDGHMDCGVVMDPAETKARGGICPVCGKPLTIGVLHRVMDLADREKPARPANQPGFVSLIPLAEVLGEIHGVAPASKAVKEHLARLTGRLGSELSILSDAPLEDLAKDSPILAEAVSRMRAGKVFRQAGFDGKYGRVTVFAPGELDRLTRGGHLVAAQLKPSQEAPQSADSKTADVPPSAPAAPPSAPALSPKRSGGLNEHQRRAATAKDQRLLVLAGPGTGKTHTLLARVRHLVESGANPAEILVLTFTRRAAQELKDRLGDDSPAHGDSASAIADVSSVRADTLHSLGHDHWTEAYGEKPVLLSEEAAMQLYAEVNPELTGNKLKLSWQQLTLDRERMRLRLLSMVDAPEEGGDFAARYAKQKASWNLADYTDLLEFLLEKIETGIFASPFKHILVDEAQDLSPLQLAVIRGLAAGKTTFFAIGDPNQSIYGFRGAVSDVAKELQTFWPDLSTVTLTENYRSTQNILDLAHGLFPESQPLAAVGGLGSGEIIEFASPQSQREISWMAAKIRQLLGPTSSTLIRDDGPLFAPGDIAVLTRFKGLMGPIQKTLDRFGVPACVPESDAFWADARVKAILNAAGNFLGMARMEDAISLACPDHVLAQGPAEIAGYLRDTPPFDHLFWRSPAFGELVRAYGEFEGWAGLLSYVNGQTELELVGRRSEKVRIMTLHASKGLEFEAVFLPALEDGILPFAGAGLLSGKPTGAQASDEAEEARLLYVGLTRAKSMLYLSHCARRELYGRLVMLKPSRFLQRLDLDLARRSKLVAHNVRTETQGNLL